MGYAGETSSWASIFPDGLMGTIIDLVLEAWDSFPRPRPDEHEVPITQRFCVHLRGHKTRSRLPFRIDPESQELDADTGALVGRIDLKFSHGYREDVYFSLECKRLNVSSPRGRRSLAIEYVDQGMMRYVTGRYAKTLDKGGMLGYVMDGQVVAAIAAVRKAVEVRRQELKLCVGAALEPSTYRPAATSILETRHSLQRCTFVIHHLFVSAASA